MAHTELRTRLPFLTVLGICAVLLLNACRETASDAAPPAPSLAPTALFIAPATGSANSPLAFDATTSSSTDGSALQYFWDFGDGQRGSGPTIARLFATGGARSVKLTVVDGTGRTATLTKVVTVAAPPAATSTIAVEGAIRTLAGVALDGVTVSLVGGSATGVTDAMGKVHLNLGTDVPLVLKLAKAGYADQFVVLTVPSSAGSDAYFEAVMRTRDAALTLADAAVGGTLTGRDGVLLTLPANALVTAAGTPVTGAVQVAATPVDVTQEAAAGFPGAFDGVTTAGVVTPIVSFGVAEFILTAGGQPLQLAPGTTATIEVPVYATLRIDGSLVAAGDTVPLWSLDETTGVWVQEGEGTIVASAGSPSGLAMRATVGHFSWWNTDMGFDAYGPQPKCVYDTDSGVPGGSDTFATATICNMLAEFDRDSQPTGSAVRNARPAAAPPSPRVVGYVRSAVLPIAGGFTIPVPAGVNIALNASALNGTWTGRSIVNGAVGVQALELVKMRPIATTGSGAEPVTAPFDSGTRSLSSGQVALFSFSSTELRYARITISEANGSNLTGRVRLLRGATALGSVDFGAAQGQFVALLPAADTYTIEVTELTNAPGAYRLQLELVGGVQSETLTLPFDGTKSVPTFTIYRGSFTIAAPLTLFLAWQGGQTNVRVLAPDGTPLSSAPPGDSSVHSSIVTLPVAGIYTLELAPQNAQGTTTRVTGAATSWQPVAPVLEGTTGNNTLSDFVADRNGKPVIGYTRAVNNAGVTGAVFMLRRWTGTAWETVGADLAIDLPCNSGVGSVSFAFDSNNDPVVAYGNLTTAGSSFITARRYTSGAWQALGPNDGTLPVTSTYSGGCNNAPRLAPGAGGALAIAYRADNDVALQRFDGTAWVGIVDPVADIFAAQNRDFDLALDPNGRLHFVLTSGASGPETVVRRLSTAGPPAWELLGPNGGVLPQTNTVGLANPKLRFDGSGNPVIGVIAWVGSNAGSSAGTAVYRYDGTQWSSTGGFQADLSRVQNNSDYMGFAVSGSDAFMGWVNTYDNSYNATVVQKNTAAGWTAIGGGIGEIPQYSPAVGVNYFAYTTAYSPRLLAVGSELYLVLVVVNAQAYTPTFNVTLLRKVAD